MRPSRSSPSRRPPGSTDSELVQDSLRPLSHRETALHLAWMVRVPLSERLDLHLCVGPSLFVAAQDVAREWEPDGCTRAGGWCRSAYGVTAERGSMLGFSVGTGLSFDVSRSLSVVARLRHSFAPRLEFAGLDADTLKDPMRPYNSLWWAQGEPEATIQARPAAMPVGGLALTLGMSYTFR